MEQANALRSKSPIKTVKPINLPQPSAAPDILHILKDIDEMDNTSKLGDDSLRDFSPNRENSNNKIKRTVAAVGYEDEKNKHNSEPLISLRSSQPRVVKRKAPNSGSQLSVGNSTLPTVDTKNRQSNCNTSSMNKSGNSNNNKGNNSTSGPPGSPTKCHLQASNQSPKKNDVNDKYNKNRSVSTDRLNPASSRQLRTPSPEPQDIVRPRPRVSGNLSPKIHSGTNNIPNVAIVPNTPDHKASNREKIIKLEPKSPRPNGSRSPRRRGGWL